MSDVMSSTVAAVATEQHMSGVDAAGQAPSGAGLVLGSVLVLVAMVSGGIALARERRRPPR